MNKGTTRRRFLQLAAGAGVASHAALTRAHAKAEPGEGRTPVTLGDAVLLLEFDAGMRSRLWHLREGQSKVALTSWAASEYLLLKGGGRVDQFTLQQHSSEAVKGRHGSGTRLTMTGVSPGHIEKRLEVELFERYPGIAFYRVSYRNGSPSGVAVTGWGSAQVRLLGDAAAAGKRTGPEFWSYCGSTHQDRRDWVQPVGKGFSQENFMGMTASDYGGGTPIVDLWRRGLRAGRGAPGGAARARLAPRQLPRRRREPCCHGAPAACPQARRGPEDARDLRGYAYGGLLRNAECLPADHG